MTGFVDLHTHGLGAWDTRQLSPAVLAGLATAHGAGGTDAFLVTLYPAEVPVLRQALEVVGTFMERRSGPGEAQVLGVHLEGPFLNPQKAGALNAPALRAPRPEDVALLLDDMEAVVKIITVAPEIAGAENFIRAATERGVRVQMGHSEATWDEARRGKEAGATGVTHLWNAMAPLHHRAPGLVGYSLWDDDLYVEVIPDGEHVVEPIMKMTVRLKPRDRILFVSDSVARSEGSGERTGDGAVRADDGSLLGGAAPLGMLINRLRGSGFTDDFLLDAARDNALRYLDLL